MNEADGKILPAIIRPIGVVRAELRTPSDYYDYRKEVRVSIFPEFKHGLVGIEYFSHLWVIYQQHRSHEWLREKGWGESAPLVLPACDDRSGQGVFSSRAPCRPANLGSCICKLVRCEGATLVLCGLDAFDGTPVLDVKPYVPQFDAFPQAVVPLRWARVMDSDDDVSHASREFHWDTTNVEFALGLRAGLAVLARLGIRRGVDFQAAIEGSLFFAQGFEMATGCSPLRGKLEWTAREIVASPWRILFSTCLQQGTLMLVRDNWPDAASVFGATEQELFRQTAS